MKKKKENVREKKSGKKKEITFFYYNFLHSSKHLVSELAPISKMGTKVLICWPLDQV